MEFDVRPTRLQGVILPPWQRNHTAVRGELCVSFESDADLNRPIKVARLLKGSTNSAVDALPPLYDVELVTCRRDLWSMTGFERRDDSRGRSASYQQSWLMVPAEFTDREKVRSGTVGSAQTPNSENGILATIAGADVGRGAAMLPPAKAGQAERLTVDLVAEHVGLVCIEYKLMRSSHGRSGINWFWTACRATALERPNDISGGQGT